MTSHTTVDKFLECQAEVVEEQVINNIKESSTYGIMVDEYTDVSARKHLAVIGKFMLAGEARLSFLTDIELPNGTTHTIYSSLKGCLTTKGININNMTSLASHGPEVMVGKKNGVVAKLTACDTCSLHEPQTLASSV